MTGEMTWSLTFADSDLKDTHLTLNETERLAEDLKKLHNTYKLAIESMRKSKKEMDRELSDQTATQWELDHQSKRTTEYVERIAQMKVDIAALQERIPKNGMFLLYLHMGEEDGVSVLLNALMISFFSLL